MDSVLTVHNANTKSLRMLTDSELAGVVPTQKPVSVKTVLLLTDNEIASGLRYIMPPLIASNIPVNMAIYAIDQPSNFEYLVKLCRDLNVGIVGISLFSARRKEYESLTTRLRAEIPGLLVVCGGPDVNSDYRPAMEWADFICRSDGEVAFPILCRTLLEGGDVETADLPNIFFKRNGKVFENRLISDTNLDNYEFPYFGDDQIYSVAGDTVQRYSDRDAPNYNVYASRGCPYKCTFCANHLFAKNSPLKKWYRIRSVENLMQELKAVKARNPRLRFIAFHDEEFGAKKSWFDEFATRYKEEIGIPFFVQINPKDFTRDVVRKLKDAGLISASFGLQTASERIRKIYERPEKLEDVKRANGFLSEFGVSQFFDVIVDSPLETREDLAETLMFILSLTKPFVSKTFDLSYLPETEFTNKLLNEGYIQPEDVEGNFVYDKLSWRVRAKDVKMGVEMKYVASLITLCGNLLIPNGLIRSMFKSSPYLPMFVKKAFSSVVLTESFNKLLMRQNALVNIIQEEGYTPALTRVLSKMVGYRWSVQRTRMQSKMWFTLRRRLTGI